MSGVGCGAIELRRGKSYQGSEHYARASSGVVGLKISCIHKTDSQECKTPMFKVRGGRVCVLRRQPHDLNAQHTMPVVHDLPMKRLVFNSTVKGECFKAS